MGPTPTCVAPFTGAWSGLVSLVAPGLRAAVERRYLATPEARASAHRTLASYFAARPVSPRVVEELPWHLAALGEWPELARRLADPALLRAAWPVHRYQVHSYWSVVEVQTPLRMVDMLSGLADALPAAVLAAAQLLADAGHRPERCVWSGASRFTATTETGPSSSPRSTSRRLSRLESGDLASARSLSEREADVAESSGDMVARVTALARLGAVERRLYLVERSNPGRSRAPGPRAGESGSARRSRAVGRRGRGPRLDWRPARSACQLAR